MEYSFYDFLKLLGSLALFLYGMKIMSEGLQKFAGDRLRKILTAMTTNRVTGVLTGVLITALIQSSSATTVMVVSFVNAGLLTLSQSIGVIMGANIGTTVTAWIISALGFKVDIAAFALPLLAFGIPLLFSQKSHRKSIGEFIFGFSFLFMGLSMLQSSLMQMDVGPLFGLFLQSFFIGITMRILSIIIFVIVYGRMIEIYCMVSLAPIPMATWGNHEQSHMGQNYLKCLFALGFQGFLILICVAIYAVLIQSVAISGDAINSIWSIVGYTVLLCFSLFKTSSVTKSVLGAH